MRALNNRYRGKDEPTDVISFYNEMDEVDLAVVSHLQGIGEEINDDLGDVYICPGVVADRKEHNVPLQDELKVVAVHGLLHLCGYDHNTGEDAKEMAQMEEKLLSKCNRVKSLHQAKGSHPLSLVSRSRSS
eukprot:m.220614 g.220614  ORF g.220614 m.220614 type:complete len:131 (+) comp13833_c0_seq3:156-548(+)